VKMNIIIYHYQCVEQFGGLADNEDGNNNDKNDGGVAVDV